MRASERASHVRSAVVQAKTRKLIDERHKGGICLDDDTQKRRMTRVSEFNTYVLGRLLEHTPQRSLCFGV